jgi:RNA polymerase sigma-70 factor (ECF subfamily)
MTADDAALLRALNDEYAPALRRYVISLTGSTLHADDIVQETLLRAWRKPTVLDQSGASARAWLFTVAHNLVIDGVRSARSVHEIATDELPDAPTEDDIDARFDRWLVADALAGLSLEHRAVIVHGYYGGRSTAEIAGVLGIPEGTVKSRMHYGLRALKLALQEKGVTR